MEGLVFFLHQFEAVDALGDVEIGRGAGVAFELEVVFFAVFVVLFFFYLSVYFVDLLLVGRETIVRLVDDWRVTFNIVLSEFFCYKERL